jgi:IS1 family transposase
LWISENTDFSAFELDEIFWFIKGRKGNENGINTYVMTMMSRMPRQIVGFNVDNSVNAKSIQEVVNSVPSAEEYYTDGGTAYMEVIFDGKHRRNTFDKSDTHRIESTNADLRHHIKGLSRRSRCFFRSVETMTAVLSVFLDAYNKFGEAKEKHRVPVVHKSEYPNKHLHKWRYPSFSLLDFL